MRYLRQSTSVDVGIGPFLDETDGKTAETALTITQPDIRLKKNGGAWAQKNAAQTLSHEEAGWYELTLDATDTDTVGHLLVAVHEAGALPVWVEFTVVETAVYDALYADAAPGYLQPTVSGRTLDVSAGGEAGIDWGNVGSPTTTVNLSGTTLNLDATLLVRLGLVSYGVLDAGSAGGFTLPSGQRANVAIGDMLHVTGKGARIIATYNSGTGVGTVASNFDSAAAGADPFAVQKLPKAEPLTSGDFADNFLTSGKIATDAVGAAQLASDAVTELQSGLATASALTTLTGYVDTEVAAIKAKTDLLPASPAATGDAMALTSGERLAVAAALLDLADAVEVGLTPRETLRLLASALGGTVSGGGTATEVFRNAVANTKARITATVDSSGNRTVVATDLT